MEYKIILASGSPRRKEILEQVGADFTIAVSDKEEKDLKGNPEGAAIRQAELKAEDVARQVLGNAVIIGADTIVVQDNRIFGKPADAAEAEEMLQTLQGRKHRVLTGVCVLIIEESVIVKKLCFAEETEVEIITMDKRQVKAYISTGEPMDKAGAYGIQGRFAVYISQIRGDYYNVVGLPVSRIHQELLKENHSIIKL